MDKKLLNDIGASIAQLHLQLQVMSFSVPQICATLFLSLQNQLDSFCCVRCFALLILLLCYIEKACQLIYVMLSIMCCR